MRLLYFCIFCMIRDGNLFPRLVLIKLFFSFLIGDLHNNWDAVWFFSDIDYPFHKSTFESYLEAFQFHAGKMNLEAPTIRQTQNILISNWIYGKDILSSVLSSDCLKSVCSLLWTGHINWLQQPKYSQFASTKCFLATLVTPSLHKNYYFFIDTFEHQTWRESTKTKAFSKWCNTTKGLVGEPCTLLSLLCP